MRVLITGGTGFVGVAVTRALRERGDTVVTVSRSGAADTIPLERVRDDLAEVDAVVNLAGETIAGRWTAAKKEAIRSSRLSITRTIVDAMRGLPPRARVLVSASAVGIYGETFDEVDESAPPGHDFLASVCVDWEAEADRAVSVGVRVVKPRIGLVLGADGGVLKELAPMYRAGLGGPIGGGAQWWSWVHLDDVVALIVRALDDTSFEGPINAVGGAVTQRDFARALGAALHRPAVVPTPAFALRLALGEGADPILIGQRVVARRAASLGFRFGHSVLSSALEAALGGRR